jgi:hypothetical protein
MAWPLGRRDVRPGDLAATAGFRPLGERMVVAPVVAQRVDDRQATAALIVRPGFARHRAPAGGVPHHDEDAAVVMGTVVMGTVVAGGTAMQADPYRRLPSYPGQCPRGLDRIAGQFRDDQLRDIGEFLESPFPQHVRDMAAGAPWRARERPKLQRVVPRPSSGTATWTVAVRSQRLRAHGSVSFCPL